MNLFFAARYQLYLLQLEEYHIIRYLRVLSRTGTRPIFPPRKALVWTLKARMVFVLAVLLSLASALTVFSADVNFWLRIVVFLIVFGVFVFLIPFIFCIFALILLWPVDFIAKSIIISRARAKISRLPNLKIIGITGSFGKTTMKSILATILAQGLTVVKTPESVNTPVGIARVILRELSPKTQVFIVEMGAYKKGDIKKLCSLARPDISIISGINEAHLERFKTLENTIMTKFEIVTYAKPRALIALNKDNALILENYHKYLRGREVLWFSSNPQSGEIYPSPLLGDYVLGMIRISVAIAEKLRMTKSDIMAGVAALKPVPHRLEPRKVGDNIFVIDDSYNGNPDGVRAALNALAQYRGRRKIYLTPGLVEMGACTHDIHRDIGRQLAKAADIVILIKNSVTPFIEEGIMSTLSPEAKIIWFENVKAAHEGLREILKAGDVILFQNDWPDNYL